MTAPLTRWIDEAQHALDHAPTLTVDHIHALLATPEAPGRVRSGVTWYLEEATRLLRAEAFELRAAEPSAARDLEARTARRTERVEGLLAQHAEALRRAEATPHTTTKPKRAPRPARPTALERAIAARTTDPHPTQDAAA
jgi:hypothetical protein